MDPARYDALSADPDTAPYDPIADDPDGYPDAAWHEPMDDALDTVLYDPLADERDELTTAPTRAEGVVERPARHMAADRRDDVGNGSPMGSAPPDSSLWTRLAGPVSIVVVTLCALVAIASVAGIAGVQTGGSGDSADGVASLDPAPGQPTTTGLGGATTGPTSAPAPGQADPDATSTSTTSSTTTTSTSTSTTEPPSADTTAEPPPSDPSDPSDPLALCSEGQLALVDRGNHPWSWVVARLDTDGDGILCN